MATNVATPNLLSKKNTTNFLSKKRKISFLFINIIRCKLSKLFKRSLYTILMVCRMTTYWYFLYERNVVILHSEINKK